MSGVNAPTYDELRAACRDLQKEIAHYLVVEQDLIYARDRLDRELGRAKAIQSYSQKAIRASSPRDFAEITVESVVETLEVECSALLAYDGVANGLKVVAAFGLEQYEQETALDRDWAVARRLLDGGGAFIERAQPGAGPLGALGLCQVIACPYYDGKGGLRGLLAGGVSEQKVAFYGELSPELIPSFEVFTRQMSSLLHNLESQEVIRKQVEALSRANAELQEQAQKLQTARRTLEDTNRSLGRNVRELSTLHAIAAAITSIRDLDELLDTVLTTVVRDLGYDRALIMLVDEKRGVLGNGRVAGAAETVRLVQDLERPIREGQGVLVQVVLSGEPILIDGVENPGSGLDLEIVDTHKTGWSLLAVPLRTKEKVTGVIAVDNFKSGARLSKEDESLLSTLAGQVAISIENARLYADLQQEIAEHERAESALRSAHDESELRVRERTAELSAANARLRQEILERTQVEVALKEAREAAEAANRTKSNFLARMSHELRTPMNSVIGFAELILDGIYGDAPAAIREAVSEIQKSGEHLLGLINDVLDISRIEAGRMDLRLTEGPIEDCIETVLGRVAPLAKEKGLKLTAEIRQQLPACVFDAQRITQVLFNLVGNAIKFTRSGEVRIGVKPEEHQLLFWVADTGIGIPQGELLDIFSEFRQVDSSITREAQGSGLGLAIARKFVEMHGGRIWAESEVGAGSTFWFTLPLRGV